MKYYTTGIQNIDDRAYGLNFLCDKSKNTVSVGYIETDSKKHAENILFEIDRLFDRANIAMNLLGLKIKISIEEE